MEIKIENNDVGKRIDVVIMEHSDYSRSKVQKLIEDDKVLVNDKISIHYSLLTIFLKKL